MKDVSHVVTKLEMIGNNGYATIKILNTSAGKNVQEIIRGKGKIGISTRSVGSVSPSGIVQKDLKLLALDLVANPSVADATIGKENILEGIEFEGEIEEEDDREQVMYELLSASYGLALTQGFTGDFDLYSTLHEKGLREVMGLPANENTPTQRIANAEQQIKDRTYSYFREAQKAGYIGDFNAWKTAFPKLVEMASEEKVVVEKKKEISEPFKSKATLGEIQLSGFVGTINEWKEQYPDVELILPAPPQEVKKVVERELTEKEINEEAGRIFTALSKENNSLTLEDVKKLLEKEYESKREKKTRELAIFRVNRSMAGSGSTLSQEILEKIVDEEVEAIKEEREEKKRLNWLAYKRLLSD